MAKYSSGRQKNLKIGIASYSENLTSLEVIGNIGIGTTNAISDLHVVGNGYFTGFVTAGYFVGDGSGLTNLGGSFTVSYASTAGIATYATNAGIATYASTAGIATYASTAGIATYATNAGIATYASTAGIATALQNSKNFSIIGNFVTAAAVTFDGTGNVALAATITPDSIGLGTYTSGDYVKNISGTLNQITVSATSGEGSTPTLSIPNQFTAPQDVAVTRDLQVNRNLNVTGNITIGGTTAFVNVQQLQVADPDLVLGFRTDANNNDASNDTTANHGGIAIASTEGSPLVSLYNPGIGESTLATYKKIMWFKSGSFAGLGTDAWLINYAVGIGSTQFPTGTRLAAGNVQFTQNDIAVVRNINASGIITGTLANTLTLNTSGTGLSGSATYNNSGAATFTVTSNATSGNTPSTIVARDASGNFSAGTITANLTGTASTASFATTAYNLTDAANITAGTIDSARLSGTYNISISGNAATATYATSSGIATYATTANIATYATTAGIATYATTAGIATYATSSGIATYATNAGIATYASTAGIATVSQGLTGTPNIAVGIVTATSYNGSGSNLTGIVTQIIAGTNISINPAGGTGAVTVNSNAITGVSISTNTTNQSQYLIYATSTGSTTGFGVSTSGLVFNPSTNNLGIATTNPTSRFYVVGDGFFTGVVTSTSFVGNLTGTATTATNLADAANITTGTINSSRLSGTYNIDVSGNAATATYATSAGIATYATSSGISTNLKGGLVGNIPYQSATDTTAFLANGSSGTILQSNGVGNPPSWVTPAPADAITGFTVRDEGTIVGGANSITSLNFVGSIVSVASTLGIATITFLDYVSNAGVSTNVIGGISSVIQLQVAGISTFTDGPVFIGTATSTGTANQRLQVTGNAYISNDLGIGSTNPTSKLYVVGDGYFTGILTANRIISNVYGEFTGGSISGTNIVGAALSISGISTFTDGPVFIGTATSTGTANQRLQVTGGAYFSGTGGSANIGVGTTNPQYIFTVTDTGTPATSGLTNCLADFTTTANSYGQINLRNTSTGTNASGDIIITADNGSDSTNFIDLGINNSGFSVGSWTINGANDGYLYTSDGNLSIGAINASVAKYISFFTGGTLISNERMRINATGVGIATTNPSQSLHVQGNARVTGAVYDSTNSPGTSGQVLQSTVTGTQWTIPSSGVDILEVMLFA